MLQTTSKLFGHGCDRLSPIGIRQNGIRLIPMLGSMSITPTIRVIVSDVLIVAALVAIVFGYGPFPMLFAFAGYYYLCFHLKPRIPDFSRRKRHLVIRWVWNLLVISLAVFYFFFQHIYVARITAGVIGGVLILWMFYDDIRYARQMETSDDAA